MTAARAVRFPRPGEVVVEDVEVAAPEAGQLRCRALASLVSTGTELACLRGEFDERTFWAEWVRYPFSPGYSMVSRVEEVGAGVTGIRPGDRVFSFTPHASEFVLDAAEATPLPAAVSDEQAVWSSLAVTTQWAVRRSGLVFGEVAVVVGLGLLGQLLVRYLRIAGARRIVAVDPDAARLELARAGGADQVLSMGADEAVAHLAGTADAVFEVTGHPAVLAPASELVRPLGRLVLVGDAPRPSLQTLGPRIVADGISVIGVHAGTAAEMATPSDPWSTPVMLDVFHELVASGRMDPAALLTREAAQASLPGLYHELQADRGRELGVLIRWDAR